MNSFVFLILYINKKKIVSNNFTRIYMLNGFICLYFTFVHDFLSHLLYTGLMTDLKTLALFEPSIVICCDA